MPRMSVIMATAREDYGITDLDVHSFQPTFHSLEKQKFTDFELVVVDALHPQRRDWVEGEDWGFPVKYVPPHANHRFWLDRKRWGLCGQLNTGILHASGELLVRIDDCCEFPPDFLGRFWTGYQQGYFPMAMHIRYLGGEPARLDEEYREKGYEMKYPAYLSCEEKMDVLRRLYGDGGLIRDTRHRMVKRMGGSLVASPEWFYAYSSFSLQAALEVNGFNELFDGDPGEEDQDMGIRLAEAGYKDMFHLDVDHQVIEHDHKPIPESVIKTHRKPIKCDYAILQLFKRKGWHKANKHKLSPEDFQFIKQESLKSPCSPKPHYYADDCEGELWDLWVSHSHENIFDLREERMTI